MGNRALLQSEKNRELDAIRPVLSFSALGLEGTTSFGGEPRGKNHKRFPQSSKTVPGVRR